MVCSDGPALMWLLGGRGEPGEVAVSQRFKPAHLPPLHHAAGLPFVLQPPLPQDGHKLTLHLHKHKSCMLTASNSERPQVGGL